MDARRYVFEIVVPTLKDYQNNITSVRHAFLACVTAFHAVDYFADGIPSAVLRQEMQRDCPGFLAIDRIAHAFKHVTTGHLSSPIKPLNAGDVITRPPGTWDQGAWDVSRWDDPFGGVTLASDVTTDIMKELNSVLGYLKLRLPIIPKDWIEPIQTWAAQYSSIKTVYVFGSHAKGTSGPKSDLDLALFLEGENSPAKDIFFIAMAAQWRKELMGVLPVPVDLKMVSPETDKIVFPAVIQDGVKIYPS